jgi:hypothetical protein
MTLKKLSINAYSDPGFSQACGAFSVQINPESYRHSHSTQYTKNDSTDTAGVTTKFYVQDPQTITFDFTLDGTGVVPGVTSVADAIASFKTVAYSYNGAIHSPNYLKLIWGNGMQFQCRLTSLEIDYTLFQPDGTPLRAKLTVGFEEYLSPQEIVQRANKNSPDMTHARQVVAGDTLPMMCYRIYGDSKYYVQVAQYNQLSNFRQLTPGTTLFFPPLEDA